jgi:hypothetical protein
MKWHEARECLLVKHIASGREALIKQVIAPPNPHIEICYRDENGEPCRVNPADFQPAKSENGVRKTGF